VRLYCRVAGIVGDAIHHTLAPGIHLGIGNVGQAGQQFQRLARHRQGIVLHEIATAQWCQLVQDFRGFCLKLSPPHGPHGFRRDRWKVGPALRGVRLAILAHHVLAHQHVHQPARLIRREDGHVLLAHVNIIPPGNQRRAQFRHIGDWRFRPHPRQVRVGIARERGNIDGKMRGGGHCLARWLYCEAAGRKGTFSR
jgi:hypothetical protein